MMPPKKLLIAPDLWHARWTYILREERLEIKLIIVGTFQQP